MPHRDAYYWNSRDSESEVESVHEFRTNSKEPYIDPWDLENYAYIREHLESMELSSDPSLLMSGSSGEFAEANSSSFFYVSGAQVEQISGKGQMKTDDAGNSQFDSLVDHANYVAIDEVNNIYDRAPPVHHSEYIYEPRRRGHVTDPYDQSIDESSYEDGTMKDNSVFGIYDTTGHFRKVAVPVPVSSDTLNTQRDRSMSFSYGEYDYDPYSTRQQLYSKLEEEGPREPQSILPHYDDVRRGRTKPNNFGLSNYGHLKIDYSYSWNNLNKYIKCNN